MKILQKIFLLTQQLLQCKKVIHIKLIKLLTSVSHHYVIKNEISILHEFAQICMLLAMSTAIWIEITMIFTHYMHQFVCLGVKYLITLSQNPQLATLIHLQYVCIHRKDYSINLSALSRTHNLYSYNMYWGLYLYNQTLWNFKIFLGPFFIINLHNMSSQDSWDHFRTNFYP